MCFALPLCPPDRIEEAMTLIASEIPTFATSPRIEQFGHQFLAYIRNTYMGGNFGTDGNYQWNFYDRLEEGQQTNNPSEGYNYRLATRCKTSHPGFYQFSCVLGKEIENTKSKIEQLEAGNIHETSSRRAQTLQKSRLKLRHLYQSKSISLRKYLRSQGVLNHKGRDSRTANHVTVLPSGDGDVDRAVRGIFPSCLLCCAFPFYLSLYPVQLFTFLYCRCPGVCN